ncbi:MAG: DUF3617 domain-containing protein [Sedimenticola sp.]|nr:DUF3617 domain-containing protein [Sedimenticola sp.]
MPNRLTLTAILLSLAFTTQAEGIKLTPGKWQIQITSSMSMMPQPIIKKLEECIKADQLSPEELMKNSGTCSVSDVKSSGSQISWKMVCKHHGGEMAGTGQFKSAGSKMNGSMELAMDLNGQALTILNKWDGQRIGDCK